MAAEWLRRLLRPVSGMERAHQIVLDLKPVYDAASSPRQLMADPRFGEGVELLRRHAPSADLLEHLTCDNPILSLMAARALAALPLDAPLLEGLVKSLNTGWYWTRSEVLRDLGASATEPVVGIVFATLLPERGWDEQTFLKSCLAEFVAARVPRETPSFGERLVNAPIERIEFVATLLGHLGAEAPRPLLDEIQALRRARVDVGMLKAMGRVRPPGDAAAPEIVPFPSMEHHAAAIRAAVTGSEPRAVLVIGENGVGKTSMLQMMTAALMVDGWTVFEAGANDLVAGQVFIGELEGRLQNLIRELEDKRIVWIVPEFQELAWAGRHRFQPSGVLDILLPALEQHRLRIVGEIRLAAYERLVAQKPRVRSVFQLFRVAPLTEAESLELARQWSDAQTAPEAPARVPAQVVRETALLARQYFPERFPPGNLLHLLQLTHRRMLAAGDQAQAMTSDDVLRTLSQLTGLPLAVLDDREALHIDELHAFFTRRVLGQKEAVDVLVERVAMIKAGLTDATRPPGVFLFVGPTGTGKTEIAKALAEFLFGSPERLLRLDMSELQSAESVGRIVGEPDEFGGTASLVDGIRKQPFSVILLDEFEKSHPSIWDLFLQVFDDGRLTDRRGYTADFRHAIIIMTSNLGARLPHGASLGFVGDAGDFAPAAVDRAVAMTFRREFVNRLDRVVVFRPLDRGVMRELVRKELSQLRERRGLRNREWAIEWDEEVIDFLLEKGFSPDLGARPLKRAIERYLLTPLATTIVRHEVPEGDQFLFVRRDGDALTVQFVDPDAPEEPAEMTGLEDTMGDTVRSALPVSSTARADDGASEPRLETLVAEARGTAIEIETLRSRFSRLEALQASAAWSARKQRATARMAETGFWEAADRFAVLGRIEYVDRIKAGLETAGSLLRRLAGGKPGARARYPDDLVRRLALQVFLLEAACAGVEADEPWDAFVSVRAGDDGVAGEPAVTDSNAHARDIAAMYTRWAARRRMHLRVLEDTPPGSRQPFRWVAAISGYAALSFLAPEAGWHVLEVPQGSASFQRARVEVRVAPQPWEPLRDDDAWRRAATRALDAAGGRPPAIVRRYRAEPSPLVRDTVRGWRTGRLDRILAGEFDVIV